MRTISKKICIESFVVLKIFEQCLSITESRSTDSKSMSHSGTNLVANTTTRSSGAERSFPILGYNFGLIRGTFLGNVVTWGYIFGLSCNSFVVK